MKIICNQPITEADTDFFLNHYVIAYLPTLFIFDKSLDNIWFKLPFSMFVCPVCLSTKKTWEVLVRLLLTVIVGLPCQAAAAQL